jgi:ribonuclease VapC
MVVDTSAIVAAIGSEPDSVLFRTAMLEAQNLSISAVTVLETRIVLRARHGDEAVAEFDEMLRSAGVRIIPFDAEAAKVAFEAFRRFGKGQGHRAQLNIVDCVAYAAAKIENEPLLFKGDDFARTDLRSALAPQ